MPATSWTSTNRLEKWLSEILCLCGAGIAKPTAIKTHTGHGIRPHKVSCYTGAQQPPHTCIPKAPWSPSCVFTHLLSGACLAAIISALTHSSNNSHLRRVFLSPSQDFGGSHLICQLSVKSADCRLINQGLLLTCHTILQKSLSNLNAWLIHITRKILADSRGMMRGYIFL